MDDHKEYDQMLQRKEGFYAGWKQSGKPFYEDEIEEAWQRYEQRYQQGYRGWQSGV